MAVPVAALAKIAAAALSDEDTRRKLGWIVAAICSPLILTLALICSLLSGSAEHNNSAVLLCFNGGNIPGKTPAEYVAYIEDMRRSFTLLDDAIAAVNDMTENSDSLDGIRVKAVFYAIFFGEDTPSRRAHKQFVDCFVTYEERTRTVTDEDGTETEESYTVAIPIADMAEVYSNIENVLHLQISEEQKSNADSVYNLVRYGVAGGSEGWMPARMCHLSARTVSVRPSVQDGKAVSPLNSATASIPSPGSARGTPAWTWQSPPARPSAPRWAER